VLISVLNSPLSRFYRWWTADVPGSTPGEVNLDFQQGATTLKQIPHTSLKYRVKIKCVTKLRYNVSRS